MPSALFQPPSIQASEVRRSRSVSTGLAVRPGHPTQKWLGVALEPQALDLCGSLAPDSCPCTHCLWWEDLGLLSPSPVPAAPLQTPALLSYIPAHNHSEAQVLQCQLSILASTSSSHPERQELSCHQRTRKLELKIAERRPRVLSGCGVAWVSRGALIH